MIALDCVQRSPEWYAARCGRLTASCADAILAVRKKGSGELAIRANLRRRLVAERLTQLPIEETGGSVHMQRGEDCEAPAVALYEAQTGHLVQSVGFLKHDTLEAGCSPDGIVGDWRGGLELKCPKSTTHLEYLEAGAVPMEYRGQILHSLWITGLPWWDFCSFDDRYEDGLDLLRVRVMRDDAEIAAYDTLARQFLAEVESKVEEVKARLLSVAVA